MGRKIGDIYSEYKIPPNLQKHMFRVAAVASMICDNFNEPLEKDDIIASCLFHDMGNIIKYDMEYFPQYLEPEGLEYWQKVKGDYIEKYGKNEHEATLKIIKELGLSEKILEFVDQINFSLTCNHRDSNDFNTKIINYADWRIDPHGVVSYEERLIEAEERYKNKEDLFPLEEREKFIACGKDIEKQIFAKCKIKPEDIGNKTIEPLILELKNFVIHSMKTQDHGE